MSQPPLYLFDVDLSALAPEPAEPPPYKETDCLAWGPDNWEFSGSLASQTEWDGNHLVISAPTSPDSFSLGNASGDPELIVRPKNFDQSQAIVLNAILVKAYIENDDFSSGSDHAVQWRWDSPPSVPGIADTTSWSSGSDQNKQYGTIVSILGGFSPLDEPKDFENSQDAGQWLADNQDLEVTDADWRLRIMPIGSGMYGSQALRITDVQLTGTFPCSALSGG